MYAGHHADSPLAVLRVCVCDLGQTTVPPPMCAGTLPDVRTRFWSQSSTADATRRGTSGLHPSLVALALSGLPPALLCFHGIEARDAASTAGACAAGHRSGQHAAEVAAALKRALNASRTMLARKAVAVQLQRPSPMTLLAI
eukprot:2666048-Prymnesium_polylepis.4